MAKHFVPLLLSLLIASLCIHFLGENLAEPGLLSNLWFSETYPVESVEVEEEDGDEHFLLPGFLHSGGNSNLDGCFTVSLIHQQGALTPLLPPPRF